MNAMARAIPEAALTSATKLNQNGNLNLKRTNLKKPTLKLKPITRELYAPLN